MSRLTACLTFTVLTMIVSSGCSSDKGPNAQNSDTASATTERESSPYEECRDKYVEHASELWIDRETATAFDRFISWQAQWETRCEQVVEETFPDAEAETFTSGQGTCTIGEAWMYGLWEDVKDDLDPASWEFFDPANAATACFDTVPPAAGG